MRKTKFHATRPVMLTLLVAFTGCLISTTQTFSFFIGDLVAAASGTFNSVIVNLEDEEDYEDNKDEIKKIDRIGWICRVRNNNAQDAKVSAYASPSPSLPDSVVATQATPVFVDFEVSANSSRNINYDESLDLLSEESFEALQEMVLDGNFTFYATSNGSFQLFIEELELIITFTVGL